MEVNFKVHFAERYFDKNLCQYDINYIDLLLKSPNGQPLLYIESKDMLARGSEAWKRALTQLVLTNKKQSRILDKLALIYRNENDDDCLDLVDCSDNSIMYNNDFNWQAEKPNNPTKDAVDRVFDRIHDKISLYTNREIAELYKQLKEGKDVHIQITLRNFNVVYNEWCNSIRFANREVRDEQERINLYLVDLLNGTHYEKTVRRKVMNKWREISLPLIREGTDLNKYEMRQHPREIIYDEREIYKIKDESQYEAFWSKYIRPPEESEFKEILEQSARLYTDAYRRDTGGFYTPSCFVQLQNQKLSELGYNMDEYIVCDPCCGVGNLENEFGKDYKKYCYLSTLEAMDVDICKIKGFDNIVQFDFLKTPHTLHLDRGAGLGVKSEGVSDNSEASSVNSVVSSKFPLREGVGGVSNPLPENAFPKWKYKGEWLPINEICKRVNRKLMVVMNPPYVKQKGFKHNLAIEFFNKILAWQPQTIVFYYMTDSFLTSELQNYLRSGYKVASHVLSNAKKTFRLSDWAISQVIFDKDKGKPINIKNIPVKRYELKDKQNEQLKYIKTYHYDSSRPYLIKEIEKKIKEGQTRGGIIGQWCYLRSVVIISDGGKEKPNKVTTENLKWCLLSTGINFNTDDKYFERNAFTYRGYVEDIPEELFNDAMMFSLFYIGFLFRNKRNRNFLMPYPAEILGCAYNDLNVLRYRNDELSEEEYSEFDFRDWIERFTWSEEAKELYIAGLDIFRWYHFNPQFAQTHEWNDSWYDITSAIMGKDDSSFKTLSGDEDTRILNKVRTTKGTRGFGRNTIKSAVPSSDLHIFYDFFDARDTLARKINKQLVDAGLLLWERENIY